MLVRCTEERKIYIYTLFSGTVATWYLLCGVDNVPERHHHDNEVELCTYSLRATNLLCNLLIAHQSSHRSRSSGSVEQAFAEVQ